MPARTVVWVSGVVVAGIGAALAVVFFAQPWRSCPYDDSPAACAALPGDAAVVMGGLLAVLAGLIVVVAGLCLPKRLAADASLAVERWSPSSRRRRRRVALAGVLLGLAFALLVTGLLRGMGVG